MNEEMKVVTRFRQRLFRRSFAARAWPALPGVAILVLLILEHRTNRFAAMFPRFALAIVCLHGVLVLTMLLLSWERARRAMIAELELWLSVLESAGAEVPPVEVTYGRIRSGQKVD